jgi:SAM-dependent methyltransferase
VTLPDPRRSSPAALRNRAPILAALRRHLPQRPAHVLEIASGTGEHAVFFAQALPHLVWQPSDPDPANRASIAAYRDDCALANLQAPIDLDATAADWPVAACDAIFCANMVHIAPWQTTLGLLDGAKRTLRAGGVLALYGPFFEDGAPTPASNLAFDADLRARDPAWGIRRAGDVAAAAAAAGFAVPQRIAMPANNLCLVFVRDGL